MKANIPNLIRQNKSDNQALSTIIELPQITDERGNLTFAQNPQIPFTIKRIYCLTNLNTEPRGFHAHHNLQQLLICLQGSCKILLEDLTTQTTVTLNHSNQALLIDKLIWREMFDFSPDCILLCLASDIYDESDYIRNYQQFLSYQLQSKTINLKLAEIKDFAFIHSLRLDPELSRYLTKVDNDINGQIKWLENYKSREQANQEFYFIAHRNDNATPCGTVRIYNIDYANGTFEWGSFILNSNKTYSASLEVAILAYQFAFERLQLKQALFNVDKLNTKAVKFHQKLEATFIKDDNVNLYFSFNYQQYQNVRAKYDL
jgi:RimJ/RimL family protein N-acetyltransferase